MRSLVSAARLFLALLFLAPPATAAFAEETITNETIQAYFAENGPAREAHGLMAAQRQRLRDILDYFLVGDFGGIETSAHEIDEIMRTVIVRNPAASEPDAEAKIWKALSEVVLQARLLEAEAKKKDYKKSYEHYTLLVAQCIQCHQAARGWGKFPEPVTEEKPADKGEKAPVADGKN